MRGSFLVLALLVVLLLAMPAHAGVSPFWQELGGSASGDGISQTPPPTFILGTSVAVGDDGRPVVVYAEGADFTASRGPIVVKRWNGSAWETLSTGGAQGSYPQVRLSPAGDIFVAWLQVDANGHVEIHLRKRAFDGDTFDEVGSDSPGDISDGNPGTSSFALAVGADGRPVVAFLGSAVNGQVTGTIPAVVENTTQVYVRRWNGTVWEFVGSDFSGGGASNAVSFRAGASDILHSAATPGLTIDSTGAPVVAFAYVTDNDAGVSPSDIYVTRWNGSAWKAVGPAVPTVSSLSGPIRGGPGGVSNSVGVSLSPSIAALPNGRLAVAWEEQPLGAGPPSYLWVRVWNGSSWVELAGSATGSGFNGPSADNGPGEIAAGPDGRPVVAWTASTPSSPVPQVFVRRWNGTNAWEDIGLHSGSATGISDATVGAGFTGLALTPTGATATAGVPVVAWLDGRVDSRTQVFLRQLFDGLTSTLQVVTTGNGTVTTDPVGIDCTNGSCTGHFPSGMSVTLTATALSGGRFAGWGGACAFRGLDPTCTLDLTAATTQVRASFKYFGVRVTAATPSGTFGQGTVGTVAGAGLSCGLGNTGICAVDVPDGTRVVLQATPEPGNRFLNWSGGPCGGRTNATCEFVALANTSSTALFRGITGVSVLKTGNGSGNVSGPGIACGTNCFEEIFTGTRVTLTAAAPTGTRFSGWTGDVCDGQPSGACTFTVSGTNRSVTVTNQSVTATFNLIPYVLTVTPRSNGNVGNVDPLPDPVDCGAGGPDCTATLNHGTPVKLLATPIPGSRFVSWTGCTSVVGTNCSFTMTANRTVTPTYRDVTAVSLTKTGQGTVTSAPGGISCALPCTSAAFDFARNVLVTLTPAPAVGWDFIGWSGDRDCPGRLCSFNASTVNPLTFAANFSIQLKTLQVRVVGNGSVTGPGGFVCNADSMCPQLFPYGTIATLTPLAAPGFKFTGWSQDCTGTSVTTCKPTMTANHSVTATFKRVFGVTVTRQGNAAPGTITATSINCGAVCTADYLAGTPVTFSRSAPPTGRTFRWLGDCAFRGTNASCPLTIDANKSVVAEYALQRLGLTVNVSGPGTVTGLDGLVNCESVNCLSIVNYGTPVLLQATPKSDPQGGFVGEFVRWAGCTAIVGGNCSFTLTANRTIVATFRPTVRSVAVRAASADETVPLAKGALRQYSAIATFSDLTTQDVSARAIWTSSNLSVATVIRTTGLVTGAGFGTATITANFSTLTSMATGTAIVAADTLDTTGPGGASGAVIVDCSPYGETGGSLSCLPAGRSFEVECRASATFAHQPGSFDVTHQATWSSTNNAIARSLGLSDFGGPIVASFRIFTGIAAIKAAVGGVVSSANLSPVNRWVVQGTPLAVTGVSVESPAAPVTVGTPTQLQALATLGPTTGTALACLTPSTRDFSLLTAWRTVPDPSSVADVNFFGLVDPLAAGDVTIHWTYPETLILLYAFSTSPGTPPNTGTIRFNSDTFDSITHIYVHETDRGSKDVSTSLGSIAVGAQIRVFEESNPVKSATFAVTAVSDAGSYRDYTVIPFSGGLLTNGAKIKLGIVPQGNVPITVSP